MAVTAPAAMAVVKPTSRRMRVLFVINSLVYGGAETQVIALSRALAERGHEVFIHTLSDDNPRHAELVDSSVCVIADRKRRRFDPALVLRMRRAINELRPDIVHGFLLEGNLYARLAALKTGVPALNSERNDNYHIPMQHRLALILTRRMAAGVVANTYAGGRFAQRAFRLPPEQVDVVWNGVKVPADGREGESAESIKKTFFPDTPAIKLASVVAMLRPQKDHELALRVAQELIQRDRSWRFLFVGDSLPHTRDYKERIYRLRQELGLEEFVQFAGLRSDVPDIVRQSNVLLSTSIHEGFPNVVIEAMAVRTPVVSTQYSDITLILPNPWQVVESRDAAQLATAVMRANAERSQVVTQQEEWLQMNATIDRETDRLEAVYRKYVVHA